MRSREHLTKLVGTLALFAAGTTIGGIINDAATRDNQVEGIQLVDCSGVGLQRNKLTIDTLNNRAEPIHIGGQRSFYGTNRGSLNISPNEHGGLTLEIPQSGSIEKIKDPNGETIVFHSRGILYEITSAPVDGFSTSLNIEASCEN